MTTINNKTSKKGLVEYLQEVMNSDKHVLQDKSLVDMMAYTLKKFAEDSKQVMKEDLLSLAQEVMTYITPVATPLPVEAKVKKLPKKVVEETPEVPVKEEEEIVIVPDKVLKEEKPKAEKIKKAKTPKAPKADKEVVLFPETIESDAGLMSIVTNINTLEEFASAIEAGRELVLAMYWTKKLLKQFAYDSTGQSNPTEFPDDLDLMKTIYIKEEKQGVYALSVYTESMQLFNKDSFTLVEGVRYNNNAEWQLYEVLA